MFWSTSKEQKPSSPPTSSDHPGVREREEATSERDEAAERDEAVKEKVPATDASGSARLPRRQQRTPPESPSSKRGGELGSEPPKDTSDPSE